MAEGHVARMPLLGLAAILIAAVGFHLLGSALDSDHREDLDRQAIAQARAGLETQAQSGVNGLRVLAATAAVTGADAEAFRSGASSLARTGGLRAVSYVTRVPASDRAEFERRIGASIVELRPNGDVRRARNRAFFWAVAIVAADSAGAGPTLLGLDVGSDPERRRAITHATATGEPSLTRPLGLIGRTEPGAIVYAPVYEGGRTPSDSFDPAQQPIGFVGGIYDLSAVGSNLEAILPQGAAFALADGNDMIAGSGSVDDGIGGGVEISGRTWRLSVDIPDDQAVPLAILLPALGTLLVATIAGLITAAKRRERYAQALVATRMRERDQAEARHLRAEREFAATFDESPIGIAIVGLDGRFESANRSLCDLLGRREDELRELHVMDLALPDDALDEPESARRMINGDLRHYQVEKRYLTAGGRPIWLSVNAVLIRDRQGAPHHFLAHVEDVTERRNMRDRLQELADLDELTGLLNRRGFDRELQRKLFECDRYGASGALLLLDLDDMKEVNDAFGHASGDALLQATADALTDGSRKSDIVGRVGGDEFAVILPRGDGAEAAQAAQLLLARLGRERQPGGNSPIAASVGVVAFADLAALNAEAAMNAADLAMYEAKRAGGRRLSVWNG